MFASSMFTTLRIPFLGFSALLTWLSALLLEQPVSAADLPQPLQTVQTALAADPLEQQQPIFLLGHRAFQAEKFDDAQRSFTRALEVTPILADYSLYYLGTIALKTGRTSRAQALFQRLLTEHKESPWRGHAALSLAECAFEKDNWDEAVRYADRARSSSSPEETRNTATLLSAQAQEHRGNARKAYYLYQQLRRQSILLCRRESSQKTRHTAPDTDERVPYPRGKRRPRICRRDAATRP